MLIDTHCHIDQFPSPEDVVRECEKDSLRVVAVTNLPSHFAIAADRLRGHPLVSAALGMHPLSASDCLREVATFKRLAPQADFIGEVGLDFSKHGIASKSIQERVFSEVLQAIRNRPRFVTLHSRGAEQAVLEALERHSVRRAVFHWFTGSEKDLQAVFEGGHFVSINPAMLSTERGQRVLRLSPDDRVLVESDGPFAKVAGKASQPKDVGSVYSALSELWSVTLEDAARRVEANFNGIVHAVLSGNGC
jgi:TatD DNase family protein